MYPRAVVAHILRKAEPALGIVKAVGELPAYLGRRLRSRPEGPHPIDAVGVRPAGLDLGEREVPGNALSDWWLSLPEILQPKQVSMILRSALAGNLWQQTQLTQKMIETWPTFRKCLNEVRTAVKMVRYKVEPYDDNPKQAPSDRAQARADFVRRCFKSFAADRFADEENFKGMVYDLTDAIPNGVSIVELIWTGEERAPEGGVERRIRAAAWVHPRHYGITPEGSVGVADDGRRDDPLAFNALYTQRIRNRPEKYLVAKNKSKSGSFLGAGEMRALAIAWLNIIFAVDWMRNFGQKYGNPFMAIPYTPGIAQTEIDKFEAAAKRCAAQGYIVYPANTVGLKPEVIPPGQITGDNPIRVMVDIAERWCVQLLLGQTLTSDVGKEGSGAYALGQVHGQVKQEKLEGHADWIAEILEKQLAVSLLTVNYGDAEDCPHVSADFTKVETPMEAAQRIGVVQTQCRMPVVADEAYDAVGLRQPQPGDIVLVNGQLAKQDEPMSQDEKFEKQLEQQVQQAEASMALQAEAAAGGPGGFQGGGQEEPAEASDPEAYTRWARDVIAGASEAQLAALEPLVLKAKAAREQNGEWDEVKVAVRGIALTNRVKLFAEEGKED